MDIFTRLGHAAGKVRRVRSQAQASTVGGLASDGSAFREGAPVGSAAELISMLSDDAVRQLLWQAGRLRRAADVVVAMTAEELGARGESEDAAELSGLASDEIERLADAGAMIAQAEQAIDAQGYADAQDLDIVVDHPWWLPLCVAMVDGDLSVASARELRDGLGDPGGDVSAADLTRSVDELLAAGAERWEPAEVGDRARRERARLEGETPLLAGAEECGSRPVSRARVFIR